MLKGTVCPNKFGKPPLHFVARRYDWATVTEISAKCANGILVYADVSWIDMSVLAALQNYKAQLEGDVAELTAQAGQLWESIPDGIRFEYEVDEVNEGVPSCSFWPTLEQSWTPGSWNPAPERYSTLGVAVVDGCCTYCRPGNGLVQREIPPGGALYLSAVCPVCGWRASWNTPYVTIAFAKPFVPLARILEALSRFEDLLRLVVTAVTVLLAQLRSASYKHAIVTSQRNFFTHHGAHPPRVQPQRESGLFSEKAFQLHVAA
jgi:hypothetical protein